MNLRMRASDLHRLARTLREIALEATGNTGPDRVNPGELAVLEDIARHPGSAIRDITSRTGLAQSLVSRIVRAAAEGGALSIASDEHDRRRVRVELSASARATILQRASNPLDAALAARTPGLTQAERRSLQTHLTAAADLLERALTRS